MKKVNLFVMSLALLGSGMVVGAVPTFADGKIGVEEHVKNLKEKLKLTSDQESQVREIVQAKKVKVEEAKQDAHEKIRALLTDDQRAKFNTLMLKKEKDQRD